MERFSIYTKLFTDSIRKKYIIYSISATMLGGILGSIIGFIILPKIIWDLYQLIFDIPMYSIDYNQIYVVIGILISTVCICGTTILTVNKIIKEKPSDLMRPKAPSNGKRILLEKIPFIWKNISFLNKVTIRNLFRYKKRVIMTIVGIMGCTALILSGFGIRDSIVDIASVQYNNVFNFDEMVYLTSETKEDEIDDIFKIDDIKDYTKTNMVTANGGKYSINILIPDDVETLNKVVKLNDLKSNKVLKLVDNEIIISDKIAQLTNTKVGDKFVISNLNNKEYEFKVSGIVENYIGNYVYMNKKTYEHNINTYNTNVVYINLKDIEKESVTNKTLINSDNVMGVVSINMSLDMINNMFKSLDSVVLILIILSALLSFVVLYNISYINISERKREIATLKVLGFTNSEVDSYITKETIILTIVGILLGFGFGIILVNYMINTVEIEMVRFIHNIKPFSFIISGLITIAFTLIVNIITHFALIKIDMIESLKSVE